MVHNTDIQYYGISPSRSIKNGVCRGESILSDLLYCLKTDVEVAVVYTLP